MDGDAILVIHLVQLINEADASVCQHQRPALQRPFPGQRILLDCCRQTHRRCALACASHIKHHIKMRDLSNWSRDVEVGQSWISRFLAYNHSSQAISSLT